MNDLQNLQRKIEVLREELDMETEKAVIDSIRQIKAGKTLLMVTHHMSLANECDFMYKIEDKKIVRVK